MEIRSVTAHRPDLSYLQIQSQCVIAVHARPRLNHPQKLEFLMVVEPLETVCLLSNPSASSMQSSWPEMALMRSLNSHRHRPEIDGVLIH